MKATDIATVKELNIIRCLGGFHVHKPMGSMGSLMGGLGLEDIFCFVMAMILFHI